MPAKLIRGKEVADKIYAAITTELQTLSVKTGRVPGLGIITVGEGPSTLSSLHFIEKESRKLGFYFKVQRLPASATLETFQATVEQFNRDEQIHGVFCQPPLPETLPRKVVQEAVDPWKDVGGMHPINAGKLFSGQGGYPPCGAQGLLQVIEYAGQPIQGQTAVLISSRGVLSRPLALLLLNRNASITFCPTVTRDLPEICRDADIVVTEAGKPGLVGGNWIKPGAVVIDANANRGDQFAGDLVLPEVATVAGWVFISPAGADDPLTVSMLLKNTLQAFKQTF